MLRQIIALYKQAGGVDFYEVIWESNPDRAFRKAVDEAESEGVYEEEDDSDEGGYSGTIAEKDGFKIVSRIPVTQAEAEREAERDIDNNDKFGPAFARALTRGGGKLDGWLFYGHASQ